MKINNKTIKHAAYLFIIIALVLQLSCTPSTTKPIASDTLIESTETITASKDDRDQYREALTALNNNNLAQAQRLFSQFIRKKPKLAGGYSNLALIYFKKHEFEKSLEKVNKALILNPEQAQALNIRAQLHIKSAKIHEAKVDYLKAIKIKANYINAHYNLALLYDVYLQDIALAVKHYKIYLSLLKKPDTATEEWVAHLEGTLKDG